MGFVARQMQICGRTSDQEAHQTAQNDAVIIRRSETTSAATTTTSNTSEALMACCAESKPRISARGADIR